MTAPNPPGPLAGRGGGSRLSFRSWRVRNRLLLLVTFPLLAAIALAVTRIDTLYQDQTYYSNAKFQASTANQVEQLLIVLQEERQAAAVCEIVADPCSAPSNGAGLTGQEEVQQQSELQFQTTQTLTNQVISQLTPVATIVAGSSSYSASLRAATVEAVGRTRDLNQIRAVVTNQQVPFTTAYNAYTNVIDDVLAVLQNTSAGTSDPSVNQDESALTAIDNMIEAQAEAQVFTAQVIALQSLPNGKNSEDAVEVQTQTNDLSQATASQNAAVAAFESTATPPLIQSYQSIVTGSDVAADQASIQAAAQALQSNTTVSNNTVQSLSDAVTSEYLPVTIGDMRAVQTAVIDQMIADSDLLLTNAKSDLYKNAALILIAMLLSLGGALLIARSLVRPLQSLRTGALDIAANRLPEIVRRLRDSDGSEGAIEVDPIPISSSDEIGQVARAFDEVHQQAVRLASEQALLRSNVNSMFVNLSRRSQSLVQRQLRLIDELENSEQDPDQLANLFKLDHLATRMRRNGENLLVLAGEEPGRKWSQAVRLLDVTRAGASEVEQYERVALRDLPDVNVLGRVVNDLVHLVAELLENATSFSAPETRVTVTANMLNTGGVMLEVEDAGIGMTPEELDDANERLANPPVIDVAISRRMGLYVVGRLATRHGVQVRLRRSAGGGITALVLIPSALLAGVDGEQQPLAPELSATGARSLGALPRRSAGQLGGFPIAGDGGDLMGSTSGSATKAPPFGGATPGNLLGIPGGPGGANGGPDRSLPQRLVPKPTEPLADSGSGAGPGAGAPPFRGAAPGAFGSIPAARSPFEDRTPDSAAERTSAGTSSTGSMPPVPPVVPRANGRPELPGPAEPADQPVDLRSSGPLPRPAADPDATSQFPRIKDASSTGQFPKIKDPSATGQFPKIKDPTATGQFPKIKDPAATGQFPSLDGPGSATRESDAAATAQFPRIPSEGLPTAEPSDPLAYRPGPIQPVGLFAPQSTPPAADKAPVEDRTAAGGPSPLDSSIGRRPSIPPVVPSALPNVPPVIPAVVPTVIPTPGQPAAFGQPDPDRSGAHQRPAPAEPAVTASDRLPALAGQQLPAVFTPTQAPGTPSGVERLFSPTPLPPAPATDERLPIFEAMESEWFRRRDEARTQAEQAAAQLVSIPAGPSAAVDPAPRAHTPAASDWATAAVNAGAAQAAAAALHPAPAPAAEPVPAPAPIVVETGGSAGPSAPVPAEAPAQPIQALPTEPIPGLAQTTAAPGGVTPMEDTPAAGAGAGGDRVWDSPGDEGWRAAQAAAKPVAAGLTPKGLPKRVPKSNLVPGSAGGTGAAKATAPVFPARSAEAVRGRLSSFHQGLKQGRDAASATGGEEGPAGQDPAEQ
ncbi:MAG TPA: nitrate- and nitrite sensing domain-containing protein [Actinocrinis sp.]|nr:nitrate- and nitrite sensing domain-containing protein [Actinocrinis sp.]